MKNRHDTEDMINIKTWKDPAFKKKMITDTRSALKEMGMKNLPESIKIRVIEEHPSEWCIVLRAPPANAHNLTDEELKNASGGGSPTCCPI